MELLSFFNWLENSSLGQLAKSYGGVYAMAQSIHLFSMALLGGTVLATDLRLMNVILRDVPSNTVSDQAHKWFKIALAGVLLTGVFMVAGVATKAYYNAFYWAKMYSLGVAIVFVFAIKRPVLKRNHAEIPRWLLTLIAAASITLWFTVAATGRWIGFS
jgi:hypothetical protein